ncbi:hypothetical protein NKH45_03585 [Mesorhizobium sp. M1156]|uniref:hypothetical protein n=1 Tax=Mesorhizobium sp. M1156 TaxID=2957064 RepID=UPI003337F358
MSNQLELSDLTDEAEVRRFSKIIHERAESASTGIDRPGHLQLCRLHHLEEAGLRHERFKAGDHELMADVAIAHAGSGHNVWVEGRTVRAGLPAGSRGSKADTVAVFALVIDADADKYIALAALDVGREQSR